MYYTLNINISYLATKGREFFFLAQQQSTIMTEIYRFAPAKKD